MSNQREPGKLIVLEGSDGVGKSTLARCLVGRLMRCHIRSEHATFPGKRPGTIGQVIYQIHHDPGSLGIEQLSPTSLQALHIAAHLDAIERGYPTRTSRRNLDHSRSVLVVYMGLWVRIGRRTERAGCNDWG